MTNAEKQQKLNILSEELTKVDVKIGKLLVHRENLQSKFNEIKVLETKEQKVPSQEEKDQQSLKQKEELAKQARQQLRNFGYTEQYVQRLKFSDQ